MASAGFDPVLPRGLAGSKRPRSKIPRRRRIPSPLVPANASKSATISSFDDHSLSFASELTAESSINFAGSAVPRRPRSCRRITQPYSKKLRSEPSTSDLTISEVTQAAKIPNSLWSGGEDTAALDLFSDLACSEQISEGDHEIESEYYYGYSDGDYSDDYSICDVFDSADDEFSQRSGESSDENSPPSATYSLFLQLVKQFVGLSGTGKELKFSSAQAEEFREVLVFKDSVDEESYRTIRSTEREKVMLSDFTECYCPLSKYGNLILQQRLRMVNWIVERVKMKELHHETLFVAVSILDRFLCRGYFQTERNLQLLGIASVTLATRLEENQPYNSISEKEFTVGRSVYSRSEVVSMEWMLMKVLDFQCLLPTAYNFLWFYLKAAKADTKVESLSRYLAVLSLLDHKRLSYWPSTVAACVVILACIATNKETSCQKIMQIHVRTKKDDLPECIQSLEWLVKYAC